MADMLKPLGMGLEHARRIDRAFDLLADYGVEENKAMTMCVAAEQDGMDSVEFAEKFIRLSKVARQARGV